MTSGKPPQIKKGTIGPIEWSGTALDAIEAVNLVTTKPTATKTAADFAAYDQGQKIQVYFNPDSTQATGKVQVEFVPKTGPSINAYLFIIDKDPSA